MLKDAYIICPTKFLNRWTDDYRELFILLKRYLGFKIIYTSKVSDIPEDARLLLPYSIPTHSNPECLMKVYDLPSNVKIISWAVDLQSYGRSCVDSNMRKMMERSDVVLAHSNDYFCETYSEYCSKLEFFPHFVLPYRYIRWPLNESPMKRVLVSGNNVDEVYPLRSIVGSLDCSELRVDSILPPYWGQHHFREDRYPTLLRNYAVNFTCPSIFRYVVRKYLEVMAVGSILVAPHVRDCNYMRLVPDFHFVKLASDDKYKIKDQLMQVLENQDFYSGMRKTAREHVLQNHTIVNRFEQLVKLFCNMGLL